jgi:uncharacterized membrane protein
MQPASKPRVTFIDWMRGVAALIMLQGHTFDAFLRTAAAHGSPTRNSWAAKRRLFSFS